MIGNYLQLIKTMLFIYYLLLRQTTFLLGQVKSLEKKIIEFYGPLIGASPINNPQIHLVSHVFKLHHNI